MKVSRIYFPLMAAAMLASCSNDNEPANTGGEINGETRYLAVNICNPLSTRAEGNAFEYGEDYENAVTSATFILLKNNVVTDIQQNVTLTPWTDNKEPQNVARVSNAVLVIDGATVKTTPDGIIAVLNTTPSITKGMTLAKVQEILGAYVQENQTTNFVMSNSVYMDNNNKVVTATAVSEEDFADNKDNATPVDIYVERVAAKVSVAVGTEKSDFKDKDLEIELADGSKKSIYLNIDGLTIANVPTQSFLLKNLNSTWTATIPFANWNDEANFRSYWALNPSTVTYSNKNWSTISGNTFENGSFADDSFYITENAGGATSKTSVLVTAHFTETTGEGDAAVTTNFEFVRIAGSYYTKEGGLTQIVNMLNSATPYYTKSTVTAEGGNNATKYTLLEPGNFRWAATDETGRPTTGIKDYQNYVVCTLDADTELYEYVGEGADGADADGYKKADATVASINTTLQSGAYLAWYWTGGKAYYFVEIQNEAGKVGIVRNHVYKLSLDDIEGFGVPVFNPSAVIIPENPEDGKLWYLKARVNVLQWKIESQNISFKQNY